LIPGPQAQQGALQAREVLTAGLASNRGTLDSVILRCTNTLLRKRNATLVEAPPSEDGWYANLRWLDRRKCLLLAHAGTLFPVFTAEIRSASSSRSALPGDLIETALRQENLPPRRSGPLDPDSLHLVPTASRGMLGFRSKMGFACRYHVEDADAPTKPMSTRSPRAVAHAPQ
jgi:hypothetical protein